MLSQQASAQQWEQYPIFAAGENGAHSHRIPALVTASDGSLVAIAEARWESWVDKTLTDIVARRSTDGGKSWSAIEKLTCVESGAYMDPTPIVDRVTGEIFLFFSHWPEGDHSGDGNRAFLVTSKDNGLSWSSPREITKEIAPGDLRIHGFGPGIGIQMEGGKYKGRMILPVRMLDTANKTRYNVSYYSDDHGATWSHGEPSDRFNEVQFAESPKGVVIANIRDANVKWVSRSYDGGISWSESVIDEGLPSVGHGCQSSIYGRGKYLWYTGVTGRPEDPNNDNRADLQLFTSRDGGHTWCNRTLLWDEAAAYSCISFLPDGRMAIMYEAADTPGFVRDPERKDWMRIDIMILPKSALK